MGGACVDRAYDEKTPRGAGGFRLGDGAATTQGTRFRGYTPCSLYNTIGMPVAPQFGGYHANHADPSDTVS
jgi:hypothetical protein